jgi:hypothetical protein
MTWSMSAIERMEVRTNRYSKSILFRKRPYLMSFIIAMASMECFNGINL